MSNDTSEKRKVSLIAALSENRVIGKDNQLPWMLKDERERFLAITKGHPNIMGRKSHESAGEAREGRTTIVLSRDPSYHPREGALLARSIPEAMEIARQSPGSEEIIFTGGTKVFEEALKIANCLYITIVHTILEGDAYFPKFDMSEWEIIEEVDHFADEWNQYDYTDFVYERKNRE